MTRYKIDIEYDGTNLIGWQENQDGDSVQSLLIDAIEKFCGARPDVVGAGRTDAGVHAVQMTAHFDLDKQFPSETVKRALNFYLINQPVSVLSCEMVNDEFNARFSCTARHYKYVVLNRSAAPVLEKNRVWWVPQKLNIDAMQNAAQKLLGNHDFTSFRAAQCQAHSPIKTLDKISVRIDGDHIIFELSARS